MGLWQRLFGASEKTTDAPAGEMGVEWEKAKEFIAGQASLALEPAMPEARRLMQGISQRFLEVKGEVGRLFLKPIDSDQPSLQRIANQMRENYVKRASQAADEIRPPESQEFADVERFHGEVVEALKSLNKTAFDNRYLIGFYQKDFERLGEIVQPAARQADELSKWLEKNRPAVEALRKAEKTWGGGERLRREISECRRKAAELEAEASLIPGFEEAGADRIRNEIGSNSLAIAECEAEAARAKSEAVEAILPLQRLFRKYEHASGKRRRPQAARQYAENAWPALEADAGHEILKGLCRGISELIAEGGLAAEPKELASLENLSQLISTPMLEEKKSRVAAAGEKLAGLRREKDALEKRLASFMESERRLERLRADEAAVSSKNGDLKASLDSAVAALQEELCKATGKNVALMPPKPETND